MNNKLIAVGSYQENFHSYLPYEIKHPTIYQSEGLKKNILKRHPDVQLGIKLDVKNNYLYVTTLHTITDSKLRHGIQNGRLKKFDK